MYPRTDEESEEAREECEKMVTKRALASAVAGLSPIAGPDITADIAILLELLPRINRRFGFAPDQIDSLDEKTKITAYQIIRAGGKIAGTYVTKDLVVLLLKKIGVRISAKTAGKFVPFIGPVVSSAISYAGMRYIGRSHIRECVDLASRLMKIEGSKKGLAANPKGTVGQSEEVKQIS